jgi:hypothetical protein
MVNATDAPRTVTDGMVYTAQHNFPACGSTSDFIARDESQGAEPPYSMQSSALFRLSNICINTHYYVRGTPSLGCSLSPVL